MKSKNEQILINYSDRLLNSSLSANEVYETMMLPFLEDRDYDAAMFIYDAAINKRIYDDFEEISNIELNPKSVKVKQHIKDKSLEWRAYAKGFIELVWAYYTEYKKGNINRIDGIIEFMTIISWAAIRPIEDTPLENGGFSYYRDERYWAKARYYYSMWDGSLNNENIYKKAYIFINKNDIKTVNIYCLAMKIYEIIARDPTYDPDDEDIFNKLNTNQEILDLLCKFPNLYKKNNL